MGVGEQGRPAPSVTAWFGFVIFGYSYKAVVCGLLGRVLGIEILCEPMIAGIDVNHWIETLIYCPLLWLALHQVNADVFAPIPSDPAAARVQARRRLVGDGAIAIVLYGTGVHIANVVEINAREQQGLTDGPLYDLIYFLDEGLSHWLQFVPLFFVIGWFVVHDRGGRAYHPTAAVVFGLAHGIERAIGIIEGGKWFIGPPTVVWLAACVTVRIGRVGPAARSEFFVRYAAVFCVVHPLALAAYRTRFGSFAQPSTLGDARLTEVVTTAVVLIVAGGLIAALIERRARAGRLALSPEAG